MGVNGYTGVNWSTTTICSIENKKNSPDFNFQLNYTKLRGIRLYLIKHLLAKFELD